MKKPAGNHDRQVRTMKAILRYFERDGFAHVPLRLYSIILMSIFFRNSLGSWLVLGFKAVVQEQKQAKASLQRHERDVQLEAAEIWEINILKILKSAKADRCFEALPYDVRILPRFHHLSSSFIIFHHLSSNFSILLHISPYFSYIVALCALLRGLQVSRKIRQAESRAQAEERSRSVDSVLIQCESM